MIKAEIERIIVGNAAKTILAMVLDTSCCTPREFSVACRIVLENPSAVVDEIRNLKYRTARELIESKACKKD